eukprot:RCo039489
MQVTTTGTLYPVPLLLLAHGGNASLNPFPQPHVRVHARQETGNAQMRTKQPVVNEFHPGPWWTGLHSEFPHHLQKPTTLFQKPPLKTHPHHPRRVHRKKLRPHFGIPNQLLEHGHKLVLKPDHLHHEVGEDKKLCLGRYRLLKTWLGGIGCQELHLHVVANFVQLFLNYTPEGLPVLAVQHREPHCGLVMRRKGGEVHQKPNQVRRWTTSNGGHVEWLSFGARHAKVLPQMHPAHSQGFSNHGGVLWRFENKVGEPTFRGVISETVRVVRGSRQGRIHILVPLCRTDAQGIGRVLNSAGQVLASSERQLHLFNSVAKGIWFSNAAVSKKALDNTQIKLPVPMTRGISHSLLLSGELPLAAPWSWPEKTPQQVGSMGQQSNHRNERSQAHDKREVGVWE